MATVVDQELIAGRRSASVKGLLTPDQALRILLAGTGLSIRYASDVAFTLDRADGATTLRNTASTGSAVLPTISLQNYFADLQEALRRLLCGNPQAQPGRYRLGLQLCDLLASRHGIGLPSSRFDWRRPARHRHYRSADLIRPCYDLSTQTIPV
jgi:hypothetical protein